MHRDIVTRIPATHGKAPIEVLGSSPKCQYQGLYCRNRFITIQGHPEFNAEIVSEILKSRNASGIIDDDTFADAMSRVKDAQDGVVVAAEFLRFLIED